MGWKKMGKKLHWHWPVSTTPLIGYFEPGKAAGQLVNLNQLHAIASWNLNFSFMAGENASSKKAFHNWLVGNLATSVKLVNLVPVMATLFCRAFSTLATSRKWSGDPMRLISPKKLAKDIKTRSCKKKSLLLCSSLQNTWNKSQTLWWDLFQSWCMDGFRDVGREVLVVWVGLWAWTLSWSARGFDDMNVEKKGRKRREKTYATMIWIY